MAAGEDKEDVAVPSPRRLRVLSIAAAGLAAVLVVVGLVASGGLHHADAASDHAVASTTALTRPAEARADRSQRVADVARPVQLRKPDVVVLLPRPATRGAVQRFKHLDGVSIVTVLSRGSIHLHGVWLRLVGGDLTAVRRFTPELTA